jgi:hypothetical protein
MITYIKLLIYSCFFCIAVCVLLGVGVSLIIFLKDGYFLIPDGQIIRAVVLCIAGSAITLATIVFNLIDKFNARKKPPSDPD